MLFFVTMKITTMSTGSTTLQENTPPPNIQSHSEILLSFLVVRYTPYVFNILLLYVIPVHSNSIIP